MEQSKPAQQQKPKRQRDHVTHHMTHVISGSGSGGGGRKLCKEKRTIKSPILPYNKWEPPPPTPPRPPPRHPPQQQQQQTAASPITPRHNHHHHHHNRLHNQNHVIESHAPTATVDAAAAASQPAFVGSSSPSSEDRAVLETEVREIKRMLKSFMAKVQQRDARDRIAQEWRLVALTLDRLFFFVYLTTILVSLVAIFPWKEALSTGQLLR